MNFIKATASYEAWLGSQLKLNDADLATKHQQMEQGAFPFFRATFYRWAQVWEEQTGEPDDSPRLLAVGDLHVENFGTWRDAEGRLVWGVNDFDEAAELPYSCDLVRLATSAMLAASMDSLLTVPTVCRAILGGYRDGLKAGGRPIVLGEKHNWLTAIAISELRNPVAFWQKLRDSTPLDNPPPAGARAAIALLPPGPKAAYEWFTRTKGMGSLGHPRYIGLIEHLGSTVAREAKALTASACRWAEGKSGGGEILYEQLLQRAVRSPDPLVRVHEGWLARRLAPDCSRIELASLARSNDQLRLLRAMGWETANIHLASPKKARDIQKHLRQREKNWLAAAVKKMVRQTTRDWNDWRERNA